MKALILSAGFGTRLLPYTNILPKPLFPISGKPLLHIIIQMLEDKGFKDIIINTHHLHDQIEEFIRVNRFKSSVRTRYEPEILDTGGAIKNLSDIWDDRPFLVVNSDIYTDIDPGRVYDYHLSHQYPVTMVMHDFEEFNTVLIDSDGFVKDFRQKKSTEKNLMAFTGIHVIDPVVLDYIPENRPFGIIEAYRGMMKDGHRIKAFIAEHHKWADIGTPGQYKKTVVDRMAKEAFSLKFGSSLPGELSYIPLKGDGSDRKWTRIISESDSLIMVDHGIREKTGITEVDSFVTIGKHLFEKGLNTPEIILHDPFPGIVILEDLGEVHLQQHICELDDHEKILSDYKKVIDHIIDMSIEGAKGFLPSYCFQTTFYDTEMILSFECRYFVDAFLNTYLGQRFYFSDVEEEFSDLSRKALNGAYYGLMHRDMQSRNIMVKGGNFYFIDFQGARKGPVQYDLASLLIDPYVNLSAHLQKTLFDYAVKKISQRTIIDEEAFRSSYAYCRITRNLQMLGAFGFLTKIKNKLTFETYIPAAVKTLEQNLLGTKDTEFPKLKKMIEQISKLI